MLLAARRWLESFKDLPAAAPAAFVVFSVAFVVLLIVAGVMVMVIFCCSCFFYCCYSPNSLLWGLLLKKRGVHRLARACSVGRGLGVAWAWLGRAWLGRGVGVAWAWLGRGVGVAWVRLGRGRGVGVAWAWRGLRTWSCYCEDLWCVFEVPWPTCYGVNDTDYHHHQQQKQ